MSLCYPTLDYVFSSPGGVGRMVQERDPGGNTSEDEEEQTEGDTRQLHRRMWSCLCSPALDVLPPMTLLLTQHLHAPRAYCIYSDTVTCRPQQGLDLSGQ